MRTWRTGGPLIAAHDVHAKLRPSLELVVLDAQLMSARRDASIVDARLVRRPTIDRETTVDPHAHTVVADRAKRVHAGVECDRAHRADRETLLRELRKRRAIPQVIESLRSIGERRATARDPGKRVRRARRIGRAVAPRENARIPRDGGLEPRVREATWRTRTPGSD